MKRAIRLFRYRILRAVVTAIDTMPRPQTSRERHRVLPAWVMPQIDLIFGTWQQRTACGEVVDFVNSIRLLVGVHYEYGHTSHPYLIMLMFQKPTASAADASVRSLCRHCRDRDEAHNRARLVVPERLLLHALRRNS